MTPPTSTLLMLFFGIFVQALRSTSFEIGSDEQVREYIVDFERTVAWRSDDITHNNSLNQLIHARRFLKRNSTALVVPNTDAEEGFVVGMTVGHAKSAADNEHDCSNVKLQEVVIMTSATTEDAELMDIIKRALQKGRSTNVFDAIRRFESNEIQCLLAGLPFVDQVYNGPTPRSDDYMKGSTLLHWAAYYGSDDWAIALIGAGSPVDRANHGGFTPLHIATRRGSTHLTRLLLRLGADIETKDGEYLTALCAASQRGYATVTKLLIIKGADIDAVCGTQQVTALHLAASEGHDEVIRLYMERGADVNKKDKDGYTPLQHAVWMGHLHSAMILLEHGGDLHSKSVHGWNALHTAASACRVDIAKVLLQRGASKRATDYRGLTAKALAEGKCICLQGELNELLA